MSGNTLFRKSPDRDVRFYILLLDDFCLYELSLIRDCIALASRSTDRVRFHCDLIAITRGPVRSSLDIAIPVSSSLERCPGPANIFVLGGRSGVTRTSALLQTWLRGHASSGSHIISVGSGTLQILRSGLASNRTVVMNWQSPERWQKSHHNTSFTHELFRIDRGLISCAGADAIIDMMLHGLASLIGQNRAVAIADKLNVTWLRRGDTLQTAGDITSKKTYNLVLRQALRIIHDRYRDDIRSRDLAVRCNIGQRQLQRLFRDHLGLTPSRYLTQWRLEKARFLLTRTDFSIAETAVTVGFRSVSYFSHRYTAAFGVPPQKDRRTLLQAS